MTPKVIIEALQETGMTGAQARDTAQTYERENGRSLGLNHLKKRWREIRANPKASNKVAVLVSDLKRKPNEISLTTHLQPRRGTMLDEATGDLYLSNELPQHAQDDIDLGEKAAKYLATTRAKILGGAKVTPWMDQLLEDCNRHTDISMVAVAWVMQEHGLTL